jgi:hypothetical protein
VSIRTEPASATIEINGIPHGNAPADLDLPLNMKILLKVSQAGFRSESQEFTVTGPKEIHVALGKDSAAAGQRARATASTHSHPHTKKKSVRRKR